MTKNGSNAHKARIRAHAAATGKTYRQAARSIETEEERTRRIARLRAVHHAPEELVEIREYFLWRVFRSDLPEMVKACLYVLADHVGTGRYIDPYVAHYSKRELAGATGLNTNTVDYCVGIAEGLRWITDFHDDETRLTAPGEDADMYLHFLKKDQKPIDDPATYQDLQARIAATLADPEADYAAFYEEAKRRAEHDSEPSPK
jgi:hypothetical protein